VPVSSVETDDSKMFLVTGNGVLQFDSQTGNLIDSKIGFHKENIYSLSISADDSIMATGG
jgi:hypothetical protein